MGSETIPQDSRDSVVVQVFTGQDVIGTTMDGECKLPAGAAAGFLSRACAFFRKHKLTFG